MSKVPIQNIYFLLSYAWDRLDEAKLIGVSATDSPNLVDLLARVLVEGLSQLLRQGLDRGYLAHSEDTSRPRGQIELGPSLRLMAQADLRLRCTFHELSYDVPQNRILKAALLRLTRTPEVDRATRERADGVLRRLVVVRDIALVPGMTSRIPVHRNNARYGLLLDVCELLAQELLPDEGAPGKFHFRDFVRDERKMAGLFEAFIRHFYLRECSHLRGGAERLAWQDVSGEPAALEKLPTMKTDALFRVGNAGLVIDAKYYADALAQHPHGETARIISDNLYQLFAYLVNLRHSEPARRWHGMLMYPVAESRVDVRYVIQGFDLRVKTVDLAQPWNIIYEAMLDALPVALRWTGGGTKALSSALTSDQSFSVPEL